MVKIVSEGIEDVEFDFEGTKKLYDFIKEMLHDDDMTRVQAILQMGVLYANTPEELVKLYKEDKGHYSSADFEVIVGQYDYQSIDIYGFHLPGEKFKVDSDNRLSRIFKKKGLKSLQELVSSMKDWEISKSINS